MKTVDRVRLSLGKIKVMKRTNHKFSRNESFSLFCAIGTSPIVNLTIFWGAEILSGTF
jgi:hypothetical protein